MSPQVQMKSKPLLPLVFFYCPGQGHNLLFILGRKCILAVDAFIIESSLPENIKARPSSSHGLIGCSATLSYTLCL